MDINAEEGHKVIVTKDSALQGGDYGRFLVNKYLKVGSVYTVQSADIFGWHTDVYLKEFPGILFNSVNFEDYAED